MRLVWEHTYSRTLGNVQRLMECVDNSRPEGTVTKPNRTTFDPATCRAVILRASTPSGLERARGVLRKHGLTSHEADRLLRDMAPYYKRSVR